MKKKLLAVGVAATLGALAGVSGSAICGPGPGHTSVGRRSGGVWSDGGSSRSKGYRRSHLSPAGRVQAKAQQARRIKEG